MNSSRADLGVLGVLFLGIALQLPGGVRFGDGLELVAVSAQLDVAHPPGYPLFTLLGWIAIQVLAWLEPYDAVLWVCKLAVFACVAGVYLWTRLVLARLGVMPSRAVLGAAAAAAILACSGSLWPMQHMVEVYGLNAAFLVWICWCLARADATSRGGYLVAAGTLLGFSMSHHLTSGCLLPALMFTAWPWLRRRAWRAPALAFGIAVALPMIFYGTLILRVPAEESMGIAWGATDDLSSLLVHVRGGSYGGQKLLMQTPLVPFTFTTWLPFAGERLALLFRVLGEVLVAREGLVWVAAVPLAVCAVVGIAVRAAPVGILVGIGLQCAFFATFNVPDIEDYMLGAIVLLVPFIVGGMVRIGSRVPWKTAAVGAVCGVLVLVAVVANVEKAYPKHRGIAARWCDRIVEKVPQGAALVTVDDSDLFAMWYLQMARGLRRDVAVYASNFVLLPWFRRSMNPEDPRRKVVGFRDGMAHSLEAHTADLKRLVVDPLLGQGRVFTTIYREHDRKALEAHYRLRPHVDLLTREEFRMLIEAAQGGMYHGPPVLFEVLRKP